MFLRILPSDNVFMTLKLTQIYRQMVSVITANVTVLKENFPGEYAMHNLGI